MINFWGPLTNTNLILPNPVFDDTESRTYKRINTESLGGTSLVYGADYWYTKALFKIEFDYLTEIEIAASRWFFAVNLGLPVNFYDHNDTLRVVIVQNPGAEFSQLGRFNNSFILDCFQL